ncbi:MAG TPA: PDZ domain-containing protein [Thermomicrobiales bacterium]|jgi:hypothetical protein|nr:PDZ domain-containing protein [Thermomicrobiales bacterium]
MTRDRRLFRLLLVLAVLLAGGIPLGVADAGTDTRLYVGHAARLTAQIPADWTFDPVDPWDYRGPDGFVVGVPLSGETLENACSSLPDQYGFHDRARTPGGTPVADPVFEMTDWNGGPACRVDGLHGGDAVAVVVPHPAPFNLWPDRISYVALASDPGHIDELTATLSFDAALVTPVEYMRSLIDLVEARAYWSGGVDWELVRLNVTAGVDGLIDLDLLVGVQDIVRRALNGAGDNHSRFRSAQEEATRDDTTGFGFIVSGQQVVQVATGGPADRAGLRVGDRIVAVNGLEFFPVILPIDPASSLPPESVFSVTRANDGA